MKWNRKINNFLTAQLTNESVGEIFIHGDITDEECWWDETITPKSIKTALDDMGNVKEIKLHINSYGGSVFAGNCIINLIDAKRTASQSKVVAYVEGIAASMGSGIAMVADEIVMYDNALMMLHKPLTIAYGNADEMQKAIEMLDKAENTLVKNYMRHYKGTEDELRQILKNETWLDSDECLENGLCTRIEKSVNMVASAKGLKVGNILFNKDLQDKIKSKVKISEEVEEEEMIYNKNLESFGITEEIFNSMKPQEVIDKVCKETIVTPENVLTDEVVAKYLNVEKLDTVKDSATKIKELENKVDEQKKIVDSYNEMRQNIIDETIKMGVKAKGDKFDEEKWRNRFKDYELQEIKDYCEDWKDEAELALNAGNRVSDPEAKGNVVKKVNLEDMEGF